MRALLLDGAHGREVRDVCECSRLALQLHNELYTAHVICVVFHGSVVHEFSLYARSPNVKRICAATLH